MNQIQLAMDSPHRGAFVLEENGQRLAEMTFALEKGRIIIYHTEVDDSLKGKGIAQQLLDTMVNYVREHQLKVVPLCPYVSLQFRRHADKYNDLADTNWHPNS